MTPVSINNNHCVFIKDLTNETRSKEQCQEKGNLKRVDMHSLQNDKFLG